MGQIPKPDVPVHRLGQGNPQGKEAKLYRLPLIVRLSPAREGIQDSNVLCFNRKILKYINENAPTRFTYIYHYFDKVKDGTISK